MKGIITLAVICIVIVAGVASWKFLDQWFFSAPPDEIRTRNDRYLENVLGSAIRRPTVPFQLATIVIISLVAALASFGINGLERPQVVGDRHPCGPGCLHPGRGA